MDETYPGQGRPTPLGRVQTAAGLGLTVAPAGPGDDDRLAGSHPLKPDFPGRAARIANAGSFVVADLHGRGIGEALVVDSFRVGIRN